MSINYFAKAVYRGKEQAFGIKSQDRRYHMYIIGKTGMGKSTLLTNIALNDIANKEGLCFIDPHGDAVSRILDNMPDDRKEDLIYLDPSDPNNEYGFNVLNVKANKHLLASILICSFKRLWNNFWGPRLEYILRNAILTLLEYNNNPKLGDISKLLISSPFRLFILKRIKDNKLREFWLKEYPNYFNRYGSLDSISAILNKVGMLDMHPILSKVLNYPKINLDFNSIINEKKILLVNLSKGKIGEDACNILGSLIIAMLYFSSLARDSNRDNYYLFVDEFHNFIPDNFDSILAEARKYGLCLIIAHQYLKQLDEKLIASIFGNVGTLISFKVGIDDAEILEKAFYPDFNKDDLINLEPFCFYIRMTVDGKMSRGFSGRT